MYQNLIKNYVSKLTHNDIYNFALKQNIKLEDDELNIIYDYIKNDWRIIVFGNPENLFNDFKTKVNINTYNKAMELFQKYKNKIR